MLLRILGWSSSSRKAKRAIDAAEMAATALQQRYLGRQMREQDRGNGVGAIWNKRSVRYALGRANDRIGRVFLKGLKAPISE